MKKVVIIALCLVSLFVLMVLLNRCESNGPPKGMSQETYNVGVEVLGITDKCLDGKIAKDEAVEKITELCVQLDELFDEYFKKREYVNGINTNPELDEFDYNSYVKSSSEDIIRTLRNEKFGKSIILLDRNFLAEQLGKRNR